MTKSLPELNDACLTDIHETAPAPDQRKCIDRPTNRLKPFTVSGLPTKMNDDQYDEGLHVYIDPIHTSELSELHPSSSMAAMLYNLGLANLQRRLEEAALNLFQLAYEMCKDKADNATADDRNIEHSILHKIGCIHYHQREYEKALATFALVKFRLLLNQRHHLLSMASALNCIGVILFQNGGSSKHILDNLFEALSIRERILGTEHRDVATTLNNIGRALYNTADYPKAIVYYQRALHIRRKVLGTCHVDVSASAFNVGQTHHKLGELDKSLPLYQEYFDITSMEGRHHPGIFTVLKHIGQVYHEQNQLKEAMSHYQDALKSGREVFGHFSREAASILNLLGNLLYEVGDFNEAIKIYEEGLSTERAVLHRNCGNIVVTLSNIGQSLMQQGEYQYALSKYNEVCCIQCSQPEKNVKKISETLSVIGQILTLLGKYPQAEKAFGKVISMAKEPNGAGIDLALALNYLGLVYFKQGALNSAMEKFKESLHVRSHSPTSPSSDVAELLYNIARIYLHQGDTDGALNHYKRALDVERRDLGNAHPSVGITLKLIGKLHDRCGQFEEALRHYYEALEIYQKCSSDATLSVDANDHKKNAGRILFLIARVHLRQANHTLEMIIALTQACSLFQEIGEPLHELDLVTGFDLYEVSMLHPACAPAA
jgi:tetratricopeptide (TPR) repeat protein